jgi:hypothetical protein
MAEDVVPAIEWEPLSLGKPWRFDLPPTNAIGQDFSTLELTRDADWGLSALAAGQAAQAMPSPLPDPKLLAGQMIAPIPSLEAGQPERSLTLTDVHLGASSGDFSGAIRRDVSARGARICFGKLDDALPATKTCFVWCLNGPRSEFSFTITTNRDRTFRYSRTRTGFPDRVRELGGCGFAVDAINVPVPTPGGSQSVLAIVPKAAGIDESLRAVALEFCLPDPPGLPAWETLDLYLAGLSFVLGRRLIPVGYTLFDGAARQRLHELRAAWAVDLTSECRRPSCPPVDVDEVAIAALTPRFVERSSEFALLDAMWLIWLASFVPLEAALPNLSAALECVMNAWFKSTKTKSAGKYMSDDQWRAVSKDPLSSLSAALTGHPFADRIGRRAQGANSFGVNERFERFFDEIGLVVGPVETKAIGARNKAAHGGSFTAAQYQWLGDTVRAYRTTLSRVILKLLDWEQTYVDYSTHGFPSRPLNDPLGGPTGDGQAAISG